MGKKLFSAFSVCVLLCVLGISAYADCSHGRSNVSASGDSLQGYVDTIVAHDAEIEESLKMAEGKEIILPQIEIDMAKDFYVSSGYEETEAETFALQYVKEINALYQEAIANGFTVSDAEIQEYLEQLKDQYQTADNKEDIRAYIEKFESEQAYWDFQFEMCKKDLPIQKYNAAREQAFIEEKKNAIEEGRGFGISPEEKMKIQEEWVAVFEEEKEAAVKKYDYSQEK